jgi:B-cell receptor-associated protein 31
MMTAEILAYEEQIAKLKSSSNAEIKSSAKNGSEIERLKEELKKRDRDLENLKRQASANNRAYDELADEHAKVTARSGEAKKDL